MQQLCRDRSIRLTSCAPNEPRGNGVMEQRWRIRGNDTRAVLAHTNDASPHLWWYVLRASVIVANTIPAGGETKSPWERFTGRKPSGREHRVLLCLAYYKNMAPASKVHPRAKRALRAPSAAANKPSQDDRRCELEPLQR